MQVDRSISLRAIRAEYWAPCAASNEILKPRGASVGLSSLVFVLSGPSVYARYWVARGFDASRRVAAEPAHQCGIGLPVQPQSLSRVSRVREG